MKLFRNSASLITIFIPIFSISDAATIRIDWASTATLRSYSGAALSSGGSGTGDGTLIELGYYSSASLANPFSGSWVALASTTMGDDGINLAGQFSSSVVLSSGSFQAPSTGTPLAIRYYDAATISTSNYFNAVSNNTGAWNWLDPNSPPPVVNMLIDKISDVTFQSNIPPASSTNSFRFETVVPIPEPSTFILLVGCQVLLCLRRRRSTSVAYSVSA